ncbi:MAG TPA: FAD-linked oxidase C-terminal domain-containing protein [Candidatus Paceibacterota bacterium]|nr:FAD-linked oxidase C-terminal domain-containing protein [Candidatus Paceibacterota bacterium]
MLDSQKIEQFKKQIEGDVLTQRYWREVYATDASIYKFVPQLIVLPKTKQDIQNTVKFAKENRIGITCRTAGTSVAGAAVGPGIILDFTRYFDQILEISPSTTLGTAYIRTQPGVIYDDLQAKLAEKNLFLPPVPASSRACMIGGNVATKACGGGAVKYGTLDDFMLAIEFVDADGDIINTETGQGVEKFKEKLEALRKKILDDKKSMAIINRKADVQNASTYNIFAFDKYANTNELIAHLMMGSIGTLGIFTEIKLKVQAKPTETPVSWAVFLADLYQIDNFIKEVKRLGCSGVELVDKVSLELASSCFPMLGFSKQAEVMFIVQFDEKIEATLKEFENSLKNFKLVGEVIKDAEKMAKIWELRKCLLPLTAKFSPSTKPLVSIDDVGVRIKDIPDLIKDLRQIFKDLNIQVALYGHAGTGTIHIDPVIEATSKKHACLPVGKVKIIKKIADKVYDAVFKYDGTIATEHGGGRCRSMYLKKEWGKKILKYLKEIKKIFDPEDILNPETMFSKAKIYENIKIPMKPLGPEEWPCMECAYCQNKCPAWISAKKGETGPRQFKNLIRYRILEVKEGDLEIPEIEEQIKKCVLCGNCTKTCSTIVGAKIREFNENYRNGLTGK